MNAHYRWRRSLMLLSLLLAAHAAPARPLPRPLPQHPGNIFLAGESVSVTLPPGDGADWRLLDYDGKVIATGGVQASTLALGPLPVGWYEVCRGYDDPGNTNRLTLAVLAPLKAATPAESPVALDVAMAWFYPPEKMPTAANLCSLAGVNWVRDRLHWGEMEPARGRFAGTNRYDRSAEAQRAAGLRDLQVIHLSPAWANPQTARFPLDLRDAFNFYREMARRWRGRVEAFEPWNEPDIEVFGGHIGSEIASLQKAACLGLKAGNPGIIVCQSVFALNQKAILADFQANQVGPYFETFNLHHYVGFDAYPQVYADFRAVSAGKPLWVTECSVPVRWSGDASLKEPSAADLRVQAERVARVFATALHEGPATVFYFLLPHYVEGQTQFGILRADLTPRPAYAALAAVGRLLADAKPLGRVRAADPNVRAYLFEARPDGARRAVLVAWATNGVANLGLPGVPENAYDHLGRERVCALPELTLTGAPVFALFKPAMVRRMSLVPKPEPARLLGGDRSAVVVQAVMPKERVLLAQSAYRLQADKPDSITLRVYNFSPRAVTGRIRVVAPEGWTVSLPAQTHLEANRDTELTLELDCHRSVRADPERVRLEGDFGAAGKPVLSLQFKPSL